MSEDNTLKKTEASGCTCGNPNVEPCPRHGSARALPAQAAILQWAVDNFGPIAKNRDERAVRLVEEALEVAQAESVPLETVRRVMERVYSRSPGELGQEIGGCALTLLALAENAGLDFEAELLREWQRVLSKSRDWWERKHAEKVVAGTANLSPCDANQSQPQVRWTKAKGGLR